MMREKKGKKLNNKGYSMVEIIIAVVILSIVAIPLLNSFITSIRVNTRSKEMQRVTAAAESIMEGFKAYHYDDLVTQFKGSNFKIYANASMEAHSCKAADTNPAMKVSTINNKNNATTVDTAEFYMKGLDYQGQKYDAKITIAPYVDAANYKHNGTKEYNAFERMNGYKDGVYTQTLESITNSYYSLKTQIASKLNEVDKIYGYIGADPTRGYNADSLDINKIEVFRETTVTIEDKKVKVDIKYYAKTKNYPYYDASGNIQLLNFTTPDLPSSEVVYDTSAIADAGAKLDNLFLFIYPVYKSTDSGYMFESDKYDISYTGSRDVNVFFVKQFNSTIPLSKLVTCENLFPITGSVSHVNFYHNIDENLGNESMHTGKTAPLSLLGGASNHVGLSVVANEAMIYKVNVEVYEYGQYDASFADNTKILYTLEGSMSE